VKNIHEIKITLFGITLLTLGIGIGRFIYTAMFPVILYEGVLTFDQLSYVASSNYAGYLFGSLLFSFGIFGKIFRPIFILYSAAIATVALIFAMAWTEEFWGIMAIRFTAGFVSAAMMILGSVIVMQNTNSVRAIASLFAGVGVGIFLGNEYIIAGINYAMDSSALWLGAGFLSIILLLLLFIWAPRNQNETRTTVSGLSEINDIDWWQLALVYGLAGFGYIILATYLPLAAKASDFPVFARHLWSMVGLGAIPSCYIWLWAGNRWNTMKCLTVNLVIQGICIVMTLINYSPLLLFASCIGFGATFMGTTSLVMLLARHLRVPNSINLLGLVTFTYGIGQILGPVLTSVFQEGSNAITFAVICGASALFIAAGICQACVWKKRSIYHSECY